MLVFVLQMLECKCGTNVIQCHLKCDSLLLNVVECGIMSDNVGRMLEIGFLTLSRVHHRLVSGCRKGLREERKRKRQRLSRLCRRHSALSGRQRRSALLPHFNDDLGHGEGRYPSPCMPKRHSKAICSRSSVSSRYRMVFEVTSQGSPT